MNHRGRRLRLRDGDVSVRVQAMGVLGFLKLEETIPALKVAATDANPQVRRAADGALAFSHAQAATDATEAALGDGDWMVREIAADTLGQGADGGAISNALIAALGNEFRQLRLRWCAALAG